MNGDFNWTEGAIATLRALWGTISTAEIGKQLGCTKSAVVGKSHRLELPRLPSPIAGGVQPHPVWTQDEEHMAVQLRGAGLSLGEISRRLGTHSASAVGTRLDRLGVGLSRAAAQAWTRPPPPPAKEAPAPKLGFHPARAAPEILVVARPAQVAPPPVAPPPPPIVFRPRARGACQYVTDSARFAVRFCGEPTIPGRPYCLGHCKACYPNFQNRLAAD